MKKRISKLEFLERIEDLRKDEKKMDNETLKCVASFESIELFKIRLGLQEKILNILNYVLFDSIFIGNDEPKDIKFLKEYQEFIKKYSEVYPLFIFGVYEKENFKKCLEYIKQGHTLVETESFYINSIMIFKNKKM